MELNLPFPGMKYDPTDPEAAKYVDIFSYVIRDVLGGPMGILNYYPFLIWALPGFLKNKFLKIKKSEDYREEIFNYIMVIY